MSSSTRTVQDGAPATERRTLADVSGRAIKADLRPQVGATRVTEEQAPATRLREVAAEALRASTKQDAAASEIGIHPARLSHKLQDGSLTLKQLESLGPEYAAVLGRQLVERFDPVDPRVRARRELREARAHLDVVAELVEEIAS